MSEALPAQVRVHHPFSPSTLQARESCPHYTPSVGDSAASLAGTRQHDAVENEEDSELLEDHQALAVAECLAYADNVAKKYPNGTILKEQYFPIDNEIITVDDGTLMRDFVGTTGGYPDFVVISSDGKCAEILDWKFGKQPVEDAENNLQGIAYMLGVKYRYPSLKTCTVHFVLPHQDTVDRHTFQLTPELHGQLRLRVRCIVHRAQTASRLIDFSMAKPSTSACMFCALVGKCTKVTELVLNIGKKFSPMQIPATISPNMVNDPKDTAIGLKVAQVVAAWAAGYRAMVTERAATDPDFMPVGYKLIPMQRREVVDATAIAELAKKVLPADKQAEVDKLLDIPITKVEELINIVTPRGKKKAAVEAFGEQLEKSGAVKLGNPFTVLRQCAAENQTEKTKIEKTHESIV